MKKELKPKVGELWELDRNGIALITNITKNKHGDIWKVHGKTIWGHPITWNIYGYRKTMGRNDLDILRKSRKPKNHYIQHEPPGKGWWESGRHSFYKVDYFYGHERKAFMHLAGGDFSREQILDLFKWMGEKLGYDVE